MACFNIIQSRMFLVVNYVAKSDHKSNKTIDVYRLGGTFFSFGGILTMVGFMSVLQDVSFNLISKIVPIAMSLIIDRANNSQWGIAIFLLTTCPNFL